MAGRMIAVDFACNDPDSGLFAGRVGMAQVDGNEVERWPEVRFTEVARGFRIHRKQFDAQDRKEWFGNWCWNRFWLTAREANRLVEHLRANGWRCTCGEHRFYEHFNAQGGVAEGGDAQTGSGPEGTSTRSPEGGCAHD